MATMAFMFKWRYFGQETRNVFYFAGADAVHANAQTIIDRFRLIWSTELNSQVSNQLVLYGCDAKELDVASNPWLEYGLTLGDLTGGTALAALPTQIASLVTFIALTARPNRKRSYLMGAHEGLTGTDNRWLASWITDLGDWADRINDMGTETSLAIAHVIARVNPSTGVLVGSNILTEKRVASVPATQRRRRIGVGA